MQGDVLGQDRDAPLALQVVGVEDALAHQLAVAELAALAQQAIDQRGLAVVDVGDDGNVADIVATHDFYRALILFVAVHTPPPRVQRNGLFETNPRNLRSCKELFS